MRAKIRPLERDDWPLLEGLFGAKGACGGCWCMHWRVQRGGKTWEAVKGEPNRAAQKRLVEEDRGQAVLALAGGAAVGWCSFGPKADFPRLARSRVAQQSDDPAAWVLACFSSAAIGAAGASPAGC